MCWKKYIYTYSKFYFIDWYFLYLLQDKSADFSLVSSVGIKNNILALLVLAVYEVCVLHS